MSDLPTLFTSDEIDSRIPEHETVRPKSVLKVLNLDEQYAEAKTVLKTAFPKICEKIELMWGYKECELELDRLIVSNRENRQGFPRDVLQAIITIHAEHQRQFGVFKKLDPWDIGYLK